MSQFHESISALIHPDRAWSVASGDSNAIDGGLGVFINGKVPAGTVIAAYPGVVFDSEAPSLTVI